jgi:hypothetical protein
MDLQFMKMMDNLPTLLRIKGKCLMSSDIKLGFKGWNALLIL